MHFIEIKVDEQLLLLCGLITPRGTCNRIHNQPFWYPGTCSTFIWDSFRLAMTQRSTCSYMPMAYRIYTHLKAQRERCTHKSSRTGAARLSRARISIYATKTHSNPAKIIFWRQTFTTPEYLWWMAQRPLKFPSTWDSLNLDSGVAAVDILSHTSNRPIGITLALSAVSSCLSPAPSSSTFLG